MNACRVIRCQNTVDVVHVWDNPAWGRRVELGVCADHGARLDGGEERAYQHDAPGKVTIIMGDDLSATGDEFVTGIKVEGGMAVTAPDGSAALRVVLTTKRRGSGQVGHVEFLVSKTIAENLATLLRAP